MYERSFIDLISSIHSIHNRFQLLITVTLFSCGFFIYLESWAKVFLRLTKQREKINEGSNYTSKKRQQLKYNLRVRKATMLTLKTWSSYHYISEAPQE